MCTSIYETRSHVLSRSRVRLSIIEHCRWTAFFNCRWRCARMTHRISLVYLWLQTQNRLHFLSENPGDIQCGGGAVPSTSFAAWRTHSSEGSCNLTMSTRQYHWIFKIPRGSDSLIDQVTTAVKGTPGVTYRRKRSQGGLVLIGADVDTTDDAVELMLILRLPEEFRQYLSRSANWSAGG